MPSAKSRVKKISNSVSFENFENPSGGSLLIVKTNISTRGIRKGIKFDVVINPAQSWLGLGEWLHTRWGFCGCGQYPFYTITLAGASGVYPKMALDTTVSSCGIPLCLLSPCCLLLLYVILSSRVVVSM